MPKTVDALRAMVPHTVCVVDPSGRIASANPAWVSRFGPIEGPPRVGFIDALSPCCAPVLTEALARCRAGEAVEPLVVRCVRDGEEMAWFEWHISEDGNGGVVVIGRDVTWERRRGEAAEELRILEDEAERIAGLGSWRLDLGDGSVTFSPEMYRLVGIDPNAGVDLAEASRSALGLADQDAEHLIRNVLEDAEPPRPSRFRIDLPDGGFRWLDVQAKVVRGDDGVAVAILGVAQDVTAPVLSEQALNASEGRYRSIIASMQDAYFRADTAGRVVLANEAAARMYGFDSANAMNGVSVDMFYADEGERERTLADMIREGRLTDRVGRGRRRDGSIFWVSLNIQPVLDESGVVVGTEGFSRDITDRIQAEEALRESETKFRTIADFTYDWEMWTGSAGEILYLSPSVERTTGYSREEFLADPGLFDRIIHPDDHARIGGHLGQGGDRGPCPVNFRIVRKDGEVRWMEHVCEPVTDRDGHDLGRRSSNRDITMRVQAQQECSTSVSLLQATLESTADGILVIDRDGRVASYNRRFAEIWGVPKTVLQEGDDSVLLDFVQGMLVDPAGFRTHIAELYERADSESFDILELADGRVFERYSRPQVLDGQVIGRVWSFRDASLSTATARALKESAETLAEAQAIARIGSYVFRVDTDTWTSSETMDDIFGIDWAYRRDFGGWLALVHPDDRAMMAVYFADEVLGRKRPFDKQYRVTRHNDGVTVWAHGYGRLEYNEDGDPIKMLGTIQDITLRHQAEEELRRTNASLERMVYDVAEAMGRVIEIRDQYTKGHQERVARVSKALAIEMGLPSYDVMAVEMAAVIHDIGKLSVPAEILTRPTTLSAIEFSFIREHPANGFEILKDIPFPWPVAQIVLQHHERMDGSGYPAGLCGGDTPAGTSAECRGRRRGDVDASSVPAGSRGGGGDRGAARSAGEVRSRGRGRLHTALRPGRARTLSGRPVPLGYDCGTQIRRGTRGDVYEKDYILRVIEQMGTFLRAMLTELKEHRPEDVRETSREALTLLLGLPPDVTDSLTPDGLITLLSVGGRFESSRGLLAAEVFVRRAQADEAAGLPESGTADRIRARRLLGAVVTAGDAQDVARASELLRELDADAAASAGIGLPS
jgi:PAS domain S-box-containing protein/putative nucleotidyltransferase with HDIG domain